MNAYKFLAPFYDRLTEDVDYTALANHYEACITKNGRRPEIVLDLACGTGRLTRMLAQRGYQMIGMDASAEMLTEATGQGGDILYLQQSLTELDLYGTVDAALCSLDGLNYLSPEDVTEALRRVYLFLNPGGVFAFDLHTPEKLMGLDGEIFCDEHEDLLCLWRCTFDKEQRTCHYAFDIFESTRNQWLRHRETHVQHSFSEAEMRTWLTDAGFREITITGDAERTFFCCVQGG